MTLQIIDMLYISLIIFTSIIWTLLTIVLLRLIKVLNMATEIVDFYNKIKQILSAYKNIPSIFKEKVQDIIRKK